MAAAGDVAAPMRAAVAITGTDTGVGKTVIAAALTAALVRGGSRVGVLKPVETGVPRASAAPDASLLREAAGAIDPLSVVCPYSFEEPLAPLVAAERAGRRIDLPALDAAFTRISSGRDVVVVEGAGGLLVPITEASSYETLFRRWDLDLVIVAANRLGALNHILLTVRAAEAAGIRVAGVVLNTVDPESTSTTLTNLAVLPRLLGGHRIVAFPYVANTHHIPALADAAFSCQLVSLLPNRVPLPAPAPPPPASPSLPLPAR
jgi:dethiobiotin synthetase